MTTLTESILNELKSIVGPTNVLTDPQQLYHRSKDHYWFSPVLTPEMDGKVAEAQVSPGSTEELLAVIALATRHRIPITPRGAGTGNYGQGVPMAGGILLNHARLNQILELTPDAARVQTGAKLIDIERQARTIGAELRFYPSTLMTATAGGFLAGGSGGIGSVTWGTLWDEGNVLAVTVATIEETPQVLTIQDEEAMKGVVHNCGLTCFILDLTLALAPAQPWAQFAVGFDTLEDALHAAQALVAEETLPKRLVTVLEWPIPGFFRQLVKQGIAPDGKALLLLELVVEPPALEARMAEHRGALTWQSPHEKYHKGGLMLSDFAWNHTTMWVMKADPNYTYLQDSFIPDKLFEQLQLRKARYGNELLAHIEFMKFRGEMVPQGLSIVRFHNKEQLWELMAYCESIGQWIANPHTHRLDEDVRWNGQPILDAKARWDPYGLLNPGHLKALE
ncbi:MAG: FAD-binding oxidoreductase [Chloroflexi bacterium]|nr:FAD-binding oxidoreductase [Chloroflexota bacterium]